VLQRVGAEVLHPHGEVIATPVLGQQVAQGLCVRCASLHHQPAHVSGPRVRAARAPLAGVRPSVTCHAQSPLCVSYKLG
jgi:hypothetical protein